MQINYAVAGCFSPAEGGAQVQQIPTRVATLTLVALRVARVSLPPLHLVAHVHNGTVRRDSKVLAFRIEQSIKRFPVSADCA